MPGNKACTVYVGNLDEKVSDRVLYEILIQAGRIVDLHIPRDKETNRPKGFAFAEYETEEIANYAVRLFSGLVTLYNRMLKFGISGQDKPTQNLPPLVVPMLNTPPKSGTRIDHRNGTEASQHSMNLLTPCRFSAYDQLNSSQESSSNGYKTDINGGNSDYSRKVLGSTWGSNSMGRNIANRSVYDSRNPISYPSH